MTHEIWSPLVKLLLAISEREPVSGNDLISYITQQYRMSTHTYVKARRQAISKSLVQRTPTGKKGRSAIYSLTAKGKELLSGLGETTEDVIKGFSSRNYWFKFGKKLGRIHFAIKSNLPYFSIRAAYQETIQDLLCQIITEYSLWEPKMVVVDGKIKSKAEFDIETEIRVKISAKGVGDEIASAMCYLHNMQKEEELEDPETIMEIDKMIKENIGFREVIKWYLSNVYGRFEPELFYDDHLEEGEWWLAPFEWKILDIDSTQSTQPSCDYWGSIIFERKDEAARVLEKWFLWSGASDSNLLSFRNLILINRDFFGVDIDDYAFLKLWEKIRVGPPESPVDYRKDDRPFHVPGLSRLIDRELYKKWVTRGRPTIRNSYDIVPFLFSIMREVFGPPEKNKGKTWHEISHEGLRYAEDYVSKTRFDIIEKRYK
jgi:DNA-binding MarR family transcriptional regulator